MSACRAAKKDAYYGAKAAADSLRRAVSNATLTPLPPYTEDEVTVSMNYFSLGFVSMKVSR